MATGSFQFPRPTKLADAFPPHIAQLHSSLYRNPDDLPPGAVLVVGSADTGCQITEELFESGRQVIYASAALRAARGDTGVKMSCSGLQLLEGSTKPPINYQTPRKICRQPASHRKKRWPHLSLHHFARNGVVLLGRLIDVEGDSIVLASDLRENLLLPIKDQMTSRITMMPTFVKPA